jgi:DNA-binding NarL/FixJ family response regulator
MRSLVVIADDRSIVSRVRLAARYAAGVRVLATLDGRETLGPGVAALEADVVLVDEMCQRINTLARLREIGAAVPGAAVLLLASNHDPHAVRDAFAAGAHAVLRRDVRAPALGALIGEVALGHIVLAAQLCPPETGHVAEADDAPLAPVEHLRLVRDQDARRAGTSA